jgi:hypothetical protein
MGWQQDIELGMRNEELGISTRPHENGERVGEKSEIRNSHGWAAL